MLRLLVTLALLLPTLALATPAGQPTPVFDPSGHALDAFRTALTRAKKHKGQLRIAVFGASHTAADLWTGELRRRLQARTGDAGHGFVFPVKWNLGYRHQDLQVESSKGWTVLRHKQVDGPMATDLGYAGLVAQSSDPADFARVATTQDNEFGRQADRAEVWIRTAPNGGTLLVDIDGEIEPIATKSDVVEPIFHVWRLRDGAHAVRIAPAGDGPVTVYGMVLERTAPGMILDQLGIPGMRADIVLRWLPEPWAAMLARRKPDLVVLAYGTNDVGDVAEPLEAYRETWRQVLQRVHGAAPDASCLLVGPTDRLVKGEHGKREPLPRTPAVIATQREVAAQFGCGHWDAQAAMGGPGAMNHWRRAHLTAGDDVHLNREGYTRLAELFEQALLARPKVKARKPR